MVNCFPKIHETGQSAFTRVRSIKCPHVGKVKKYVDGLPSVWLTGPYPHNFIPPNRLTDDFGHGVKGNGNRKISGLA